MSMKYEGGENISNASFLIKLNSNVTPSELSIWEMHVLQNLDSSFTVSTTYPFVVRFKLHILYSLPYA
jgi:hypothetical protein